MTYDNWKANDGDYDPEGTQAEADAAADEQAREEAERGDGTTSVSFGFEQSVLDEERDHLSMDDEQDEQLPGQPKPGWKPLKLRTDV